MVPLETCLKLASLRSSFISKTPLVKLPADRKQGSLPKAQVYLIFHILLHLAHLQILLIT